MVGVGVARFPTRTNGRHRPTSTTTPTKHAKRKTHRSVTPASRSPASASHATNCHTACATNSDAGTGAVCGCVDAADEEEAAAAAASSVSSTVRSAGWSVSSALVISCVVSSSRASRRARAAGCAVVSVCVGCGFVGGWGWVEGEKERRGSQGVAPAYDA